MKAWMTSEGVVVVEAENGTELFALKNAKKVLLIERSMVVFHRPISDIIPSDRWGKVIEINND